MEHTTLPVIRHHLAIVTTNVSDSVVSVIPDSGQGLSVVCQGRYQVKYVSDSVVSVKLGEKGTIQRNRGVLRGYFL